MSPIAESVGARIRQCREEAGLSQGALAELMGMSQAAVSQWESGARKPSVEDLYELADVLEVEVHDLLPRRGTPVPAALRAVAAKLEHAELGDSLEMFLDEAEKAAHGAQEIWTRATDPVIAAAELLDGLGYTKAPIDVDAVARACGIAVLEIEFDDALSGLVIELQGGPVIGVNECHHPNRRRFTVAHELGHVVLRHLDSFHVDLNAALEAGNQPGYNWRHERAANEFAANLLMPAQLLRKAHAKAPGVSALADLFDVSALAMGFRLETLGLAKD